MTYAPRNTMNVVHKNNYLYDELVKYGELKDSRARFAPSQGFKRKPKSDETRAKEASERRYQNRKNVCGTCFQLKSVGTGECGC
jgi:hypothetical protein